MNSQLLLREDERAIYTLRSLYSKYGYTPYKVNKFEEYDLYAKNKSFLVSENLLTFTDTNGKLMALKPDVTLSIIKNAVADDRQCYRLYYNENVYRTTPSGNGFREIMQSGLEAIGNIDIYTQCQVLMLAARSLESISKSYILDISHMKLTEGLLESLGVPSEDNGAFFELLAGKNLPGIRVLCAKKGIDGERLCAAVSSYLPLGEALAKLDVVGPKMQNAYEELSKIEQMLQAYGMADKVYLDLSVVNDMSYYDGIIFKGFINGIPDSVLSGGRYDRLMERFGKSGEAIGFAVYLDKLEHFDTHTESYDVDVMLVYEEDVAPEKIVEAVAFLGENGKSVRALSVRETGVRCRRAVKLTKEGMKTLEADD